MDRGYVDFKWLYAFRPRPSIHPPPTMSPLLPRPERARSIELMRTEVILYNE